MPRISAILHENQRGNPTLTLLNVLGVLGVLNALNVLNVLNVLYVLYVLHVLHVLHVLNVLHGRIVGLLGLVIYSLPISMLRTFIFCTYWYVFKHRV